MTISLLPEELRRREEEEKAKTKAAQGTPKFKLHLPENGKGKSQNKLEAKRVIDDISIGLEEPEPMGRGIFRVEQQKEVPVAPVQIKKTSVTPPAAPSVLPRSEPERKTPPKIEPPAAEKHFKMRIPFVQENINEHGKKIIRETADKIEDIKKPKPVAAFLKKRWAGLQAKQPPAEVNLIAADYVGVVKLEFWRRVKLTLIVILLFVLLASAAFLFWQWRKSVWTKEYLNLTASMAPVEAAINSFSVERLQAEKLKKRAQITKALLARRLSWTKVLDFLEHNLAPNVYFTSFVAEDNGQVLLTAQAKSYQEVAQQLYIFEQAEELASAEINSAGEKAASLLAEEKTTPSVEFNVRLQFQDDYLRAQ